jgi:hypothetical protein
MSLTHVDPHVSEIVMVWIQSGDLLMVWIQISLFFKALLVDIDSRQEHFIFCVKEHVSVNIFLKMERKVVWL